MKKEIRWAVILLIIGIIITISSIWGHSLISADEFTGEITRVDYSQVSQMISIGGFIGISIIVIACLIFAWVVWQTNNN